MSTALRGYDPAMNLMRGDYVMAGGQRAGYQIPSMTQVGRILATRKGACGVDAAFGVEGISGGVLFNGAAQQMRANIFAALQPLIAERAIQDVRVLVVVSGNRLRGQVDFVDTFTGQAIRLPGLEF